MKSNLLLLLFILTQTLSAQTFTEIPPAPFFDGVESSSIAFSDVNGDGHQDVLITELNSSGELISKLYTNDGIMSSTHDFTNENSLDFVLFPNPAASSTVFLSFDAIETGSVTIKVYGLNGILLKEQSEFSGTGQTTFSIDIASLSKGNYLLELDNGKRKGIAKFIIQ